MIRKYVLSLCSLILYLFIGIGAIAQQVYTPKDVPNVQLTDSTHFVSDPSQLLTSEARAELDSRLRLLRSRYQVETALVILPSIGERDIEGFSTELFRLWGLGDKKSNNGLLWLLVMDQRKVRFEVGYGLEGVLTDARSGQIQRQEMLPYFRSGDYAGGLIAGAEALDKLFARATDLPQNEERGAGGNLPLMSLLYIYLLFGLLVSLWMLMELRTLGSRIRTPHEARKALEPTQQMNTRSFWTSLILCPPMALVLWWYGRRILNKMGQVASICPLCQTPSMYRLPADTAWTLLSPYQRREVELYSRTYQAYRCGSCQHSELEYQDKSSAYSICPVCNSRAMKAVRQRQLYIDNKLYIRTYMQCLCCGHQDEHDKRDRSHQDDTATALLLGTLLGSGMRGRGSSWSGGGGFGGGSWGGGSSGGGGATSGW